METLFDTNLSLPLIQKGKVRDIYDIDEKRMLIVTTDRLSAFDVVFDQPISKKGAVLTSVANFWFEKTKHIIPNHLTHEPLNSILSENEAQQVKGRAIIVKKLKPLAVEAIVRAENICKKFPQKIPKKIKESTLLLSEEKNFYKVLKPIINSDENILWSPENYVFS